MTQGTDATAGTGFEAIWRVPEGHVASGRIPGYVAAVRLGERTAVHAGGRMAVDPGAAPMRVDTLFRIASLTKPIGGELALSLVEAGVLALEDPIARWLPEAASPRVLVAPDAPLERTVAAEGPITVRHLLTMTCGRGAVLEDTPPRAAMLEPGEGRLYDTGIDLLGVLLSRAADAPLSDLVADRVTGPLGMTDTAFWAHDPDRLATAYRPGPEGLEVRDPPDGAFARPPGFEELSSGLVSTAPDVLRFLTAMADGGGPVLSAGSVAAMTADALTPAQREQATPVVGPGGSWGLGTGVDLRAAGPGMAPGRWGWEGGTGTTAHVDPGRGTAAVLLTQREMTGPLDGFGDFWAAVAPQ